MFIFPAMNSLISVIEDLTVTGTYSFTIPAQAKQAWMVYDFKGAGGAGGRQGVDQFLALISNGGVGGKGEQLTGTFTLTPGHAYEVIQGIGGTTTAFGNIGGDVNGVSGSLKESAPAGDGSAGGGATVLNDTTAVSLVLVARGGGGGGGGYGRGPNLFDPTVKGGAGGPGGGATSGAGGPGGYAGEFSAPDGNGGPGADAGNGLGANGGATEVNGDNGTAVISIYYTI